MKGKPDKDLKTLGQPYVDRPRITLRKVGVHYNEKAAICDVSMDIGGNQVTAMIGPSGCGKSTILRCLNRMNDVVEGCRVSGTICMDGHNIYDKSVDVVSLRARIGMVFQKPNPFPKSIFENIAYGPRIHGMTRNNRQTEEIVHRSLERAGLLEEVKDRLQHPATSLSGGQQ